MQIAAYNLNDCLDERNTEMLSGGFNNHFSVVDIKFVAYSCIFDCQVSSFLNNHAFIVC